jgi:hypothetical protein
MKKVVMGLALLVFGALWYMIDTGAIVVSFPVLPFLVMLAGLAMLIKAFMYGAPMAEKKRRR